MAAVLAWRWSDDDYVVPPGGGRPDAVAQAAPGAASAALATLERAVRAGDAGAARDLAPADDEHAATRLAAVVSNAAALDLRRFSLRYVDEAGAVADDGTWAAAVDLTWQIAGFDPAPARAEVTVVFAAEGPDEAAVVSLGGGGRRTPVWLASPVRVQRTPRAVVEVAGSAAELRRYVGLAARAVPAVREVVGATGARLVVEVPRTAAGVDRALGQPPGTYGGVAAVTAAVDGVTAPGAPVHVFVNPEEMGRLEPAGAQVVVTHEATHALTDAPSSQAPLWLVEGFADYVALRDVDLPLRVTAGQVADRVRRHGAPRRLPGTDDFDVTRTHLGATYEAAWLACVTLADAAGEAALVATYRRADAGEPVGRVLREEAGVGLPQLTARWRDRLRELAS